MRRPLKFLAAAAIAILVLSLFFAFVLPLILKAVLKTQLEKNLNRPVAINSVSFNPLRLSLTVQEVSIRAKGNAANFISFDRLHANAEIISLFEGGLVLREFTLENPHVHIVQTRAGKFNFSDLLPETEKPEPEPAEPFLFSAANIRVAGGRIELDDQVKSATHRITDIELALPLLSNFNRHVEQFTQPWFSARLNGNPVKLTGKAKLFAETLETSFDMVFDNVTLAKFLPYSPVKLNFKMHSGSLSAQIRLSYRQTAANEPEIRILGDAALRGLELTGTDNSPLLKLPSLTLAGIEGLFEKQILNIKSIDADGLQVALAREKDGSISLLNIAGSDNEIGQQQPQPQQEPEPAWSVKAGTFTLKAGRIIFDDLVPAQPVHMLIDHIALTLKNISTDNGSRAGINFTCRVDNESTLAIQGGLRHTPLEANLRIDLAGLDIQPAQSYLPEEIQLALNSGVLSLEGSIDMQQKSQDPEPVIVWQGDLQLENFSAGAAEESAALVKAGLIACTGMQAVSAPLSLAVQEVKLRELFLRAFVEPDGTVNLMALAGEPSEEPLPPISISTLLLEKGRIRFTDKSITPRYSSELTDIQGRIEGISTNPDTRADIRLQAMLNNYAPLTIKGTLSPLQEKLSADIKVDFKDIDLSPFSPYSGKFIGRMVEKGRLSLELNYTIRENRLTAQNKIFLDQFTLGKTVESPQATNLPVGLAVSLLKNSKGEIHLDMPVSGSFDDPKFKVRNAILQALKNLIQKAAKSPFSLLGSVIPGGEKLRIVQFPCGQAKLGDEAKKKLDALAELLAKKTDLRLDIQPVAAAGSDREALREEMLLRRLRRLKFNDLSKKERQGLRPGKVELSTADYEKYLRQAYDAAEFEKPENMFGFSKRLPPEEMKSLLLEHTKVEDEDLKRMLEQRGLAVKQYLTEQAEVPAGRLFIVQPRTDPNKDPAGCSVEFNLK